MEPFIRRQANLNLDDERIGRPHPNSGQDGLPAYAVHDDLNVRGFFGIYRFLSNFYPARILVDGVPFPSVEHAYQAAKFGPAERERFLSLTPGQAKREGKRAQLDPSWTSRKGTVMKALVRAKFLQHEELGRFLVATHPKYLEETNGWGDTYWGVWAGIGENNLGRILMELREELRQAHAPG